jgi:ATP synthase F0 subunit c
MRLFCFGRRRRHDRRPWPWYRRRLRKALESIARQPEMKGTITTTMFMGCAVAETTGLYSLIIALILLFVNPFTGLF